MTIDARKRKNQKKKLRLKEKKAASRAAEGSIVEFDDVEMAGIRADPLIVDRVAAEEVLPPHVLKGKTNQLISQAEWTRQGSPQISMEPMGQALEAELAYEDRESQSTDEVEQENKGSQEDDNKSEGPSYTFFSGIQHEPIPRRVPQLVKEATVQNNRLEDDTTSDVAPEGSIVNIEQATKSSRRISEVSTELLRERVPEYFPEGIASEEGTEKKKEQLPNEEVSKLQKSTEQEGHDISKSARFDLQIPVLEEESQKIDLPESSKLPPEEPSQVEQFRVTDSPIDDDSSLQQCKTPTLEPLHGNTVTQTSDPQIGRLHSPIGESPSASHETHDPLFENIESSQNAESSNQEQGDFEKNFTSHQSPTDSSEDKYETAERKVHDQSPSSEVESQSYSLLDKPEQCISLKASGRNQEQPQQNGNPADQETANEAKSSELQRSKKNSPDVESLLNQGHCENPKNNENQVDALFNELAEGEDREPMPWETDLTNENVPPPALSSDMRDSKPAAYQESAKNFETKEDSPAPIEKRSDGYVDSHPRQTEKKVHHSATNTSEYAKEGPSFNTHVLAFETLNNANASISVQPQAGIKEGWSKENSEIGAPFSETIAESQIPLPREHLDSKSISTENSMQTVIQSGNDTNELLEEKPSPRDEKQIAELFKGADHEEQQLMPWETSQVAQNLESAKSGSAPKTEVLGQEKGDQPFEVTDPVDSLFEETQHEPMPWEASQMQPQNTDRNSTKNGVESDSKEDQKPNQEEQVETKKFSFLENDDDLLDDDDSYLDSDEVLEEQGEEEEEEEVEEEEEEGQNLRTVESELIDFNNAKLVKEHGSLQSSNAIETSINSPTSSHGATSRYKPNNAPQPNTSGLYHGVYEAGVMPQYLKNSRGPSIVIPQPPLQSGFASQRSNMVDGQKVVQKINEEKKKSDAFDFPMDLVSKKTERVPAKPVGASRFGSPPPFDLTNHAPPRNSRANSVASMPSNPYAAAANASKSKVATSMPPQGVVLPQNTLAQNNIPLAHQSSASQAVPFPANHQSSMRTQYSLNLRTRGFSNISAEGSLPESASGSLFPSANHSVSPSYGPIVQGKSAENKYTPASPLRNTAIYGPSSGVGPGTGPVGVSSMKVGLVGGGPYAPSSTSQKVPTSPPFNGFPNVPSIPIQNIPAAPPWTKPIVDATPTILPESYPPNVGSNNLSVGPPVGTRQKKTTSRSHARSNSSIYAPNQSEFTSKYAPTVHPQYQNPSMPQTSLEAPNPLSSINSYMSSTQPDAAADRDIFSAPKPIDNQALLQHQFPLFSWSASEKVNYGLPIDNGQNAYIVGSSSTVQNFNLVNLNTILSPKNFLKSFPGPLSKNKTRKKDLQKWFDDHIDEFTKEEGHLNAIVMSLLKLKLTDNVNFKDVSRILYNSDELLLYLSQPTMQPRKVPNAYKLDSNNQTKVLAHLQTGGQDEALQLALGMEDFPMALLIGSLMGKEKWSDVVKCYLSHEIEVGAGDSAFSTNLFSLIFQVFIGSSRTAFQEFYVDDTKCKWAIDNWRLVVAAVLNNVATPTTPVNLNILEVPPVVVEFLVEYGVFLTQKGMHLPGCILFMIANLPLSSNPIVSDVDVKFDFIGNPGSLESLVFSEIYEFCVCDSKAFPVLFPQKLYHAACLQERGLTTAASKYTDYLSGVLRTLPKKEPFTIKLTHQVNDLAACIAGNSTGWLGKPKLSSVWGHLDKSFNKLIGGDDDALINKSTGKKIFDGFTPVSSRNSSTVDLNQMPFVPYQGHSKKPSHGHSDGGIPLQPVGHSPMREPVPVENAYNIKSRHESDSRRPSQMNNVYQDSPKTPLPPMASSAGHAPPKLRRVHTMQNAGAVLPPFMRASSESLGNVADYQEKPFSNSKIQETSTSTLSGHEDSSSAKQSSTRYNSTPNLVRRSSAVSDTSSVAKESFAMVKRSGDARYGVVGEGLQETIEENDFVSKTLPKSSGRELTSDSRQLLAERPILQGPPYSQVNESSPVSTVATESATDDDDINSETEHTVLHNDHIAFAGSSVNPYVSMATSHPTVGVQGSGETLKQNQEEKESQNPAKAFESAPELNDNVASATAKKGEPGLGIKITESQPNFSEGTKNVPPTFKANPYAIGGSARKVSSNKTSYLPKCAPQSLAPVVSTQQTSEINANLNGLGMFVEQPNTSSQDQDQDQIKNAAESSISEAKVSTPILEQANPAKAGVSSVSRFDPIKEPEEITSGTFEPVIKKTPKMGSFTPLVVQPAETQYDDIVEDESEDEDEEDVKKRDEEQRRAEEEELREKERREKEQLEEERIRKAKEKKESKDNSTGGWFGWLKKDPNEKKPIKAKLGNKKRNFHYDEKLKRWVNNNATEEEKEKFDTPPPPPPVVKRVDNGPKTKPRSGSLNAAPKPVTGAVVPKNPITGEPLNSSSSSTLSRGISDVPPHSPSASTSNVNLAGKKANGLDDLLNLTGGGTTATRRKKKPGRGYVNVMEKK